MNQAIASNFSLNSKIYPNLSLVLSLTYDLYKTASIRVLVCGSFVFYGGLVLLFKYDQCGGIFALILTRRRKYADKIFAHQFVSVYHQDNPVIKSLSKVSQVLNCSKHTYYLVLLTDEHLKVQKCKLEALKLYFYLVAVLLNGCESLVTPSTLLRIYSLCLNSCYSALCWHKDNISSTFLRLCTLIHVFLVILRFILGQIIYGSADLLHVWG